MAHHNCRNCFTSYLNPNSEGLLIKPKPSKSQSLFFWFSKSSYWIRISQERDIHPSVKNLKNSKHGQRMLLLLKIPFAIWNKPIFRPLIWQISIVLLYQWLIRTSFSIFCEMEQQKWTQWDLDWAEGFSERRINPITGSKSWFSTFWIVRRGTKLAY